MAQQLLLNTRMGPPSPLADRMRPRTANDVVGQQHLLDKGRPLRIAIESGRAPNCILWGPPGTGKTTLARLIASSTQCEFVPFSAVLGGVKELRKIIGEAEGRRNRSGRGTTLFVDEIHRFNKSQQDAFLPHVETGLINLLGATTENPSFELNAALLSRAEVFVLQPLEAEDLLTLLNRALRDEEHGFGGGNAPITAEALQALAAQADGDARRALNLLEHAVETWRSDREHPEDLNLDYVRQVIPRRSLRYDRASEEHYNIASALIKSLRGSDPDASIYWLARMLEGGENPTFIARRLVIFASEDIGNADPRALQVAVAAAQAVQLIGLPECQLNLSQAVLYLAAAPKSNSAKTAVFDALREVQRSGSLPPPKSILNAPTALMKAQGYGEGYRYPHDYPGGYVSQQYLPDPIVHRRFVPKSKQGFEKTMAERLAFMRRTAEYAATAESAPRSSTSDRKKIPRTAGTAGSIQEVSPESTEESAVDDQHQTMGKADAGKGTIEPVGA